MPVGYTRTRRIMANLSPTSLKRKVTFFTTASVVLLLVVCLVLMFKGSLMKSNELIANQKIGYVQREDIHSKKPNYMEDLSFLPLEPLQNCEELFPTKTEKTLPDRLMHKLEMLDQKLKVFSNNKTVEGYSFRSGIESAILSWHLVQASFVKTVCETGFNAGHSTLIWLEANPKAVVYSFDIGRHNYSRVMAEYLSGLYPRRLTVSWGDSTNMLPQFLADNTQVKCDMISIDGGHTEQVAMADLQNFKKMSGYKNFIQFDNYPEKTLRPIGRAWESMKRWGDISEFLGCTYSKKDYGFSVGTYFNLRQ